MNIVIIEDENITAGDLAETITSVEPSAVITAVLSSVKAGIAYFKGNEVPDLIFSDVQLGDGLSFEIFKEVKISAPIIFCTAYDEYALNAFHANGIDYILKPFSAKIINEALKKYQRLRQSFSGNDQYYKTIIETLLNRNDYKSAAVLVNHKDKIIPVRLENIALFFIDNEITYLLTFDNKRYFINKRLDELEKTCGNNFFRVNRQFLLNRKSIVDASHYFARKLSIHISVPFEDKITVSKEKTPKFLDWLQFEE